VETCTDTLIQDFATNIVDSIVFLLNEVAIYAVNIVLLLIMRFKMKKVNQRQKLKLTNRFVFGILSL
jgi:hypothetical protein